MIGPRRPGVVWAGAIWVGIAAIALVVLFAKTAVALNMVPGVAPAVTAAGVAVALGVFIAKEYADRRRKTLEALEKQLYDKDLRTAIAKVVTALETGTYEPDDAPPKTGSLRDDTSFIINYVETCCEGAECWVYDRTLLRNLLKPFVVDLLIRHFLVDRPGMASRKFLPELPRLTAMQATFAAEFAAARRAAGAPAATPKT